MHTSVLQAAATSSDTSKIICMGKHRILLCSAPRVCTELPIQCLIYAHVYNPLPVILCNSEILSNILGERARLLMCGIKLRALIFQINIRMCNIQCAAMPWHGMLRAQTIQFESIAHSTFTLISIHSNARLVSICRRAHYNNANTRNCNVKC